MGMDQDEELEQAMLSISPSKDVQSSPALPVKTLVPLPKELMFLMPEPSAPTPTETNITVPGQPLPRPSTVPSCPPPPQLPAYNQDVSHWNCSPQQRIWMKMELQSMGLWPGSVPVRNPLKMLSLWRGPPQPELIDSVYDFPCVKYFQLHPFFIWKPENDNLMGRLRNNYTLPCIDGCAQPQIASAGVGRPRVIVGTTGQYYLLSSRLCCKVCRKRWYADNPSWLEKLPKRFTNLLPAVLTYKKAICKSVLDELRRSGKSPTDMAKQITELMHLKYERAHQAYLLSCKNIMDGEKGKYDQKTITRFLRQETKPARFGEYGDSDGWNGISVPAHYLTDCLLHEYQHQQGVGHLWTGLPIRPHSQSCEEGIAVQLLGSCEGEHLNWDAWMTSDAIAAQATSGNVLNTCASRSNFNANMLIKLDLFHCLRRLMRECVSEHHPLYSSFAQFLSAAFSVVDQEDLQRLKDAYAFCGIQPANPTKPHIREHCRIRIPYPEELIKRVEGVFQHFHLATDPNGRPLFKASMLKCWRIQRIHILRGCLSDPEVEGGIMYRHGGTLQLNHVPGEGAKVPVWIPIRGTSQQEGYHFHQAQWVTGTRVSTELFQAQAMTGVARWNYQRLVDLKQPDVKLPAVFDPALMGEINAVSQQVFGHVKYPAFHLTNRDTGEKFGLEYVEPDCRPALDTPPQSSNPTAQSELLQPPSIPPTKLFQFPANPPSVKQDVTAGTTPEPHTEPETTCLKSLPLLSSPTAARTGPVKTGGRVFVLDHKRWTGPMKQAVDNLLNKHHGQKDMLKLVDKDYAALVLDSCTDPNSMLHPTTKHRICQYVKHLSKLLNTSSSINISPEKLQERQVLWHSLTEGSETTNVPVVTMPVAVFNPTPPVQTPATPPVQTPATPPVQTPATPPVQTPATPPVQTPATPLTLEHVENFVRNIMANQQQQQQQQQQSQSQLYCQNYYMRYTSRNLEISFPAVPQCDIYT
ncbi:hypothetical protein NQZ68_004493 [Dissostichus eleginoides]|nr:hypothetical protein NQZ68_004493 [Dissostichus eleginoides]